MNSNKTGPNKSISKNYINFYVVKPFITRIACKYDKQIQANGKKSKANNKKNKAIVKERGAQATNISILLSLLRNLTFFAAINKGEKGRINKLKGGVAETRQK